AIKAGSAASQARLRSELAAARTPVETSFLLTPGSTRSAASATRLEIPAQADSLRFELVLPPGAASGDYAITLRAANGSQIWSRSATVAGRTANASIPASLMAAGSYEIGIRRLTAGEQLPELAIYSFHLVRK